MRIVIGAVVVSLLAGCANVPRGANYQPVVDTKGRDPGQYQADLAECQQFAQQRMDAAKGAAAGAIAGALLGAFLAPRGYKNHVAGKAAVLGGLGGAAQTNDTQESIVKRCLAGRGYNVLD